MRPDDLTRQQERLRTEADAVAADLGLAELLDPAGEAVRVGSAALGLMVRRDLDVTVVCPVLDDAAKALVAGIGARLAVHDRVREVRFRDDTGHWNTDPRYPDGLYLGVAYRSAGGREWTLDLWFVDEPDRQPDLAHLTELPPRLTEAHRAAILTIKHELAGRDEGTARVPSYEVYRAVLDEGVATVEEFDAWHARET
ncbi:hypothetical protein I5Q34_31465 [Streptomyces sp. AV19]|uniref:hypothetical protein n=1 Tax=Streptomyces sp. AV19 TaxID=2793068 RepID=UPI0018FE23C5|nr:hypothetical protein [Streptomyces sp. AV19]MBH1938729.1 hypothetical protein [Streptomyces sp. AV19]MDG4533990.1 hypothetical protein [Streptomyces sp. AV19]